MTDIEIHSKTDRELLIMIVGKVNMTCDQVDALTKWKEGNGFPGAQFQIRIMWGVFVAILAKLWGAK